MIVLDTNVISELFKPAPDSGVVSWLEQQAMDSVYTTAITRGELLYGLILLPDGTRRERLLSGLLKIFEERFRDRVLPYDAIAADAHAAIAAHRRQQGRAGSQSDLMIAGIVRSRGLVLATRNVRDFEGCGITLINPWH